MSKPVLFIGNDVNSVSLGYSWPQLIKDLIEYVGAEDSIVPTKSHFPLLYEEIRAFSVNRGKRSEADIKSFIANKVNRLDGNDIHERMLELPCEHYITTNYDFALEKKAGSDIANLTNCGEVVEARYSLFRRFRILEKYIWHIHGAANSAQSIALGFEQYSGYLQHMRNYVVSGTRGAYKSFEKRAFVKRLESGESAINSWVDTFFLRDLYIVGFSFDLAEIHLWWLLTFRARRGREFWEKKLNLKNRVVYFVPSYFNLAEDPKIRFLKSMDVEICQLDGEKTNKRAYYESVLGDIGAPLNV